MSDAPAVIIPPPAPCHYCGKTAGPLDSPEACCAAAGDVAAIDAERCAEGRRADAAEAALTLLRDALTTAVDTTFDSAAVAKTFAAEPLSPAEMRAWAKRLRAKAEAWREVLKSIETNQGGSK